MKKIICAFLAVLMIFSFCACSGGNSNEASDKPSNGASDSSSEPSSSEAQPKTVDLAAIKDKIIADVKIEEPMTVDSDKLTELYGIAAEDISESACFVTSSGTFPEEAIMIKAKDDAAKGRIVELLNARIDDVKVQSESYDADNYALAQKCKVITEGEYIAMFISASHEKMETIFTEAVK